MPSKNYSVYYQEIAISNVTSIKYASKEISNMLSGNLLKLLSRNFKYTSRSIKYVIKILLN